MAGRPHGRRSHSPCDGITILNLGPGHSTGCWGLYVEAENPAAFYWWQTLPIPGEAYYGPPAEFSGAP